MNIFDQDPNSLELFEGVSSNKWTFGQVMPIILLALPLINILESFYSGKSNSPIVFPKLHLLSLHEILMSLLFC